MITQSNLADTLLIIENAPSGAIINDNCYIYYMTD